MITRWDKKTGVTVETKAGYIHRRTDITDPLDLIPVRHRAAASQNVRLLGMFRQLQVSDDNSHVQLFYTEYTVHLLGGPYGTDDPANFRPTPIRTAPIVAGVTVEEARAAE